MFIKGFEKIAFDWAGTAKNIIPMAKQYGKAGLNWASKNPGKALGGAAAVGALAGHASAPSKQNNTVGY